jgi:MFS_1 like family
MVFLFAGRPLLDRLGPAGAAMLAAAAGIVRWAVMAETAWLPALAAIEPLHGLSFALLHLTCMAYADIETNESSMASTIASSFQQISMSFGLACGSLVAAWYLGDLPQSDRLAVITALHRAFVTLGGLTIVSSLSFWTLRVPAPKRPEQSRLVRLQLHRWLARYSRVRCQRQANSTDSSRLPR